MEFWDVIEARHSCRSFASESVPREKIERLLHAAAAAPSSMNLQPWRFHVAQGEVRQEAGRLIAQATLHLSEYVDQASEWDYSEALEWYSSLGHAPVLIGVSALRADSELEVMNVQLSVGAAIENLLLAATAEGLAACNITFAWWVRDELAELLRVSEDRTMVAVIALGAPGEIPLSAPAHRQDVADWLG